MHLGPLDWILVACLGVTAVYLALDTAMRQSEPPKGLADRLPASIRTPKWNYLPLVLMVIAGVIFIIRAIVPAEQASLISSDKSVAAPRTAPAPVMLCTDGPCAPVRLKQAPEYFKEIGLGFGGSEPLNLLGTPVVRGEKLQVAIDYSEYRSGWMPKERALIGEINEPLKGKREQLQLIYYAVKENAGTNKLWWGDPVQNHPLSSSTFNGSPLPAILVRGRVAISGKKGEQHYYFILIRAGDDIGTQVGIIPQYDAGDWIEAWEAD